MTECRWEPLQALLDAGLDRLAQRHWLEVGTDRQLIPYAPDYPRFMALESMGLFRIMSARRGGRLIGYNGFIVSPHLHYRSSLHALNDVIFVDRDERGSAGVRLIQEAERDLWEMGVVRIIYHTKIAVPIGREQGGTVGDLLQRMGYIRFEENLSKTRP